MTRINFSITLAMGAVLAVAACPARADLAKPWDNLTEDPPNWIATSTVNMYAANSETVYSVSFQTAKSGVASGMAALKFVNSDDAHHVSSDLAGSVDVLTKGGTVYGDVLVVIAIDAASLPEDFALTMNGYACDPAADFLYYDGTAHPWGRPSGYYPDTTYPTSEPIAYDFDSAMVTVLAFSGLTLKQGEDYNYTLNYDFENLPGRAVFSVYGLPTGGTKIYHTNRGVYDLNDATSEVSTFEVLPEPASLALLACGFAALLRRRRR